MSFQILDQTGADIDALKEARQKNSLQFEREKTALKYYLIGKGYHRAIKALGFIERVEFRKPAEEQYRKDRVTPSLHHQVRIALSITQLPGLTPAVEEQALVNALLHDVQEDHDISSAEIELEFDKKTADINWKLTKKFAGTAKNKEEYIREISQDLIAALDKGKDRKDNLQHMIGVFSVDKMEQYTDEAEDVFLPMVKTASKLFPEAHQALMVISLELKMQIEFSRQYIKLAREKEVLQLKCDILEERVNTYEKRLAQKQEDYNELEAESLKRIKEIESKIVKGSISPDQAKKIYIKINDRLVDQLNRHERLTVPAVTEFLADISIDLGISAFDLANYPSDKLSADPATELVFSQGLQVNLKTE